MCIYGSSYYTLKDILGFFETITLFLHSYQKLQQSQKFTACVHSKSLQGDWLNHVDLVKYPPVILI
jgi:hypothetical protein